MSTKNGEIECDIAAIFFDGENLDDAIKASLSLGVEKEQMSLLCTEQFVKDKLQADYQRVDAIKDGGSVARWFVT